VALSHWIAVFAGFELVSFLVFGLSVATAVPEEELAGIVVNRTAR